MVTHLLSKTNAVAEKAGATSAAPRDRYSIIRVEDLPTSPTNHDITRGQGKSGPDPRDRDSGVFLSDVKDMPPPTSQAPPIGASSTFKRSPSFKSVEAQRAKFTVSYQSRPTNLSLSTDIATLDASKPKTEFEVRYNLIHNSQDRVRVALKSPTQLLRDRLNLSPKKSKHEEKLRIFTPPRPMLNGCILPGPAAPMGAFTGSSVRAKTAKTRRPAWWCKVDMVVVFDGGDEDARNELKLRTRTSKGLTIARRRGDTETIVIPLNCSHCQEMLNRQEWKYVVQVCKRVVCWQCRERCRWEMEQEQKVVVKKNEVVENATKAASSRD
jgi:hypothetical protein